MAYLLATNVSAATSNGITAGAVQTPITRNFGYTMSGGNLATITFDAATDNPFGTDTSITVSAYTKPYTAMVEQPTIVCRSGGVVGYVGDIVNTSPLTDPDAIFTANGRTFTAASRCTVSRVSIPGTDPGQSGNEDTRFLGENDKTPFNSAQPGTVIRITKVDGSATAITRIAGWRYTNATAALICYFTDNITSTITAADDASAAIEVLGSNRGDVAPTGLWELYNENGQLLASN